MFFWVCLENKLTPPKRRRSSNRGANKMEWDRRRGDRRRGRIFADSPTLLLPDRDKQILSGRARSGRKEARRSWVGLAFEGWYATSGVYECRGDGGVTAEEWIVNLDLLRNDEICRSTSVPLTLARWKFMRIPRKVLDGEVM